MKPWRIVALSAALWLSGCGLALAQSPEDVKQECSAESFTLAQYVLYAKNVLGQTEPEVAGAVKAGELIRGDVQAFIRAVFQGQPEAAKRAIKRVYDTCVAVRSSHAVRT